MHTERSLVRLCAPFNVLADLYLFPRRRSELMKIQTTILWQMLARIRCRIVDISLGWPAKWMRSRRMKAVYRGRYIASWTLLLALAFQRRYCVLVGYRYVPSLRRTAAVSTVPLSPPLLAIINPLTGSIIIVNATNDGTLTMVCLITLLMLVKLKTLLIAQIILNWVKFLMHLTCTW